MGNTNSELIPLQTATARPGHFTSTFLVPAKDFQTVGAQLGVQSRLGCQEKAFELHTGGVWDCNRILGILVAVQKISRAGAP